MNWTTLDYKLDRGEIEMTKRVRKAIIPAAGLGTRFLPATKAQPKEMLPIVDKPTLQYIIEEAVASGIEEILIITGRNKKSIEDHFDRSVELELELESKDKHDLLEEVRNISDMANIHYIRQKQPKGLGHAILCAKSFVGDEPFAVLLGDDIVVSDTPAISQLIGIHNAFDGPVLGVQEVADSEVHKYGIIQSAQEYFGDTHRSVRRVIGMIEKPNLENAPSNLAVLGRYILTPDIFDILEETEPGVGDEIQLTDAIRVLASNRSIYSCNFSGTRYDVGDKLGYLKATVDSALSNDKLGTEFREYLLNKIGE